MGWKRGFVGSSGVSMLVTSSGGRFYGVLGSCLLGRESVMIAKVTGSKLRTLRLVRRGGPSLMILSVVVPRLSKLKILRELRTGGNSGAPEVVILSTMNRSGVARETVALKTSCCMIGPFSVSIFAGEVERVFGGAVSRRASAGGAVSLIRIPRVEIRSGGRPVSLRARVADVVRRVNMPTRVGKCVCLERTVAVMIGSVRLLSTVAGRLCPSVTGGCGAATDEIRETVERTVRITQNENRIRTVGGLFKCAVRGDGKGPAGSRFVTVITSGLELGGGMD